MARRNQHRRLKANYVVLGDGLTEQYYMKHLRILKNYKYSVYPSLFNSITIDIAECKIDELISGGYNLIVYFTDYDTIVNQNRKEVFERIKEKYASYPEVLICESMPSIEFWFLLHHIKTTKEFLNAKEAERELKKFISKYTKNGKNFLEKSKWVSDLCNNDKMKLAIKRASQILKQKEKEDVGRHFPFTKVHQGISLFEKMKK